jgi:cytidyltransferase-like protein
MNAKELYLLSIKHKGISQKIFEKLSLKEQKMLEYKNGRYYLKEKLRKKFKAVLTGGVFDILHPGHVLTLQAAKKFGDLLIVVVATNERVLKLKKRRPINDQKIRAMMVSFLKPVDLAIVGSKEILETFRLVLPDVVVFGYDQKPFSLKGCKTVKLKVEFKNQKTSKILKSFGF